MGVIGGAIARLYLNRKTWPAEDNSVPSAFQDRSKLEVLFGPQIWDELRGKTVLDFGCGGGREAVEMVTHGAAHVTGLEIRDDLLAQATELAQSAGVADRCRFSKSVAEQFDVVLSLDSMEHFSEPDKVLEAMAGLLTPSGYVLMSFGPPWLHPLGHHFPLFPWAHLVFTERAMMEWRSRFKNDGARRFGEVLGGLNQMTIDKFERLVEQSPLKFATYELIPIHSLRLFHNRLTREFTTSVVRCRMRRQPAD